MGIFSNKDGFEDYNIYSLRKYINKKRIISIVLIIILIIVVLGFAIYYTIDTTLTINRAREDIEQVIRYAEQKKLEDEQKRQEEELRKTRSPILTEEGKENIKNIYESKIKRVFLTFDDGPSRNTAGILDILKENNIKSAFFVLGRQVEIFPETTKRIHDEGHYIANHGYSHVYSSIYTSPEQVLIEYNQCNSLVANAIGISDYNSHLFRFPGGSVGGKYARIKNEAISILEQNDILYLDWNSLTGDSEVMYPTEEYLMNNLQKTTNEKNSLVILMHDSHAKEITVQFLPKVIEYLKENGYEFGDFYDIIK